MSFVVFDYACSCFRLRDAMFRRPAPEDLGKCVECGELITRRFAAPRVMVAARAGENQCRAVNKGVASEADHPPWVTPTESLGNGEKWEPWNERRKKAHDKELTERITKEHGDPSVKKIYT